MSMTVEPLGTHIGAVVGNVDLTKPVSDTVVEKIKAALDAYSVLVFHDQPFTDDTQTAFSARFGQLERTVYKPEGDGGVPIANITNVDFRTDELFPPGHARLKANSGNDMWHTDSSFKPVPAYCSMLSGREVPPVGADTQFATCRAAFEALPSAERERLSDLVAEHDYAYSRSLVPGYQAPAKTLEEVPPVLHSVVRINPANLKKNFYTGSHASRIVGWPLEKGRQLLRDLVEHATQPAFVYVHKWRPSDLVIWDNRCVLHRGTPYESDKYRRVMRRTTVAGAGPTVDDAGRALHI